MPSCFVRSSIKHKLCYDVACQGVRSHMVSPQKFEHFMLSTKLLFMGSVNEFSQAFHEVFYCVIGPGC